MIKKIKNMNNKVVKIWFSTYIFILVIPLIGNYFLFIHSRKIIDEEIEISRKELISSLKKDIDEELYTLKRVAILVGSAPETLKLVSDDRREILDDNKYSIVEYLEYINLVRNSNSENVHTILYLGNAKSVLYNGTYTEKDYFVSNYLKRAEFPDYSSWQKVFERKYRNEFTAINMKDTMENEKQFIVYGYSLPFSALKNSTATLFTMVSEERLAGILEKYQLSDNEVVFILDGNNQVVLSTKEEVGIKGLDYKELKGDGGRQYGIRKEEEVVLIAAESEHIQWKYVIVSQKSEYLEKNINYKNVVIISVGIYVVVGLFMALWFTKSNYKPIGQMVKLVATHMEKTADVGTGDYHYLKTAFEQAFFKMDELEQKIMEQNNVLRNNFLFRLVSGIVRDEDVIRDALERYHLQLNKSFYATVIVNIGIKGRRNSDRPKVITPYVKVAEYFKLNPILDINSEYIIRDDYIIFIINSEKDYQDNLKEDMFLMIDQLKQEMVDLMDLSISSGVSDVHDSIYGLAEAYNESMNCLEYALLYEPEEVLSYKDIVSKSAYYYPISIEQKLITYIKDGNEEEAKKTLNEIYVKNFEENKIGINMGKNLLFDISSSMLKAMDTVAINDTNLSKDIVHAVAFGKRIDETRAKLTKSLEDICHCYKEQQESIEKISYSKEVNQYINSHYKDANLNISIIAEQFSLTPSYLSKLYKQESGESILAYINQVRVREAKVLLKESDLNNSEIALSIGILNDTSFNRVFKKFEGITPGQYRKNIF